MNTFRATMIAMFLVLAPPAFACETWEQGVRDTTEWANANRAAAQAYEFSPDATADIVSIVQELPANMQPPPSELAKADSFGLTILALGASARFSLWFYDENGCLFGRLLLQPNSAAAIANLGSLYEVPPIISPSASDLMV